MNRSDVRVQCRADGDGWRCRVRVGEDAGATTHEVTMSRAELERYAGEAGDPTQLVEGSFRFLLEREPREAILRQFELPVIARYFPEYPSEIGRRLAEGR